MPAPSRRAFLKTAASCAVAPAATGQARPTNLLFVLADQWRSSAFGFGSDAVVRTPNFDQLAKTGANWRRAYASNPVCTPNRACILTGRYSHQTGMLKNNLQLPPDEVCWPELFRAAGYATHYIGKWHLDGLAKPGFVPPGWRRRGFSTFEGFNRGHVYHEPWGFDDSGQALPTRLSSHSQPYYEPTLQTDLAIDFMNRHRHAPFVCFLAWGPPHTPFKPPEAFRRYEADEIALRSNVPPAHREQAMRELAGYYGLCESLDHQMGRLVEFLDEAGLRDNTLVAFTSDHGELAGSHGKYRKGEPEDESLHVPLVTSMPGRIPAGIEPATLINSVDLMPTLLSFCGLPAAETCAGRDLSGSVLAGRDEPAVESVYCQGKISASPNAAPTENSPTQGPWRAIVTDRYKLTVRNDFANIESLFDLQEDPLELRNLTGEPHAKGIQHDLLAELRAWTHRTADTFPQTPRSAKNQYSDADL